jgi:hypothetical protein
LQLRQFASLEGSAMNSKRRPLLLLTLAVAFAGAVIGTAFAVVTDSSDPLTRDQVYHAGMSPKEVAAAASGRPGEIAPPCPDEATATGLKKAGIPFGPCDLLPEDGAPVRIPDPQTEPAAAEDGVVCPGIILGKGVDLTVEIPCAQGAEIVSATAVKARGGYCAKVKYIAGKGSPSRTETLCEGDVPAVGGKPVKGPDTSEHTD